MPAIFGSSASQAIRFGKTPFAFAVVSEQIFRPPFFHDILPINVHALLLLTVSRFVAHSSGTEHIIGRRGPPKTNPQNGGNYIWSTIWSAEESRKALPLTR